MRSLLKLVSNQITIVGFLFCIITSSCQKDSSQIKHTKANPSSTDLKRDFESRKIPENLLKLSQPMNGGEVLLWTIQWNSMSKVQKGSNPDEFYVYVPIQLTMKSSNTQFRTVNYNRYLLIKIDKEGNHYSSVYALNELNLSAAKHLNKKFSGTLYIKSLEGAQMQLNSFSYTSGQAMITSNLNGKDLMFVSKEAESSSFECITIYLCSWNTICSGAIMTASATTGPDCNAPPSYDACGTGSENVDWSYAGSVEIGRQCYPPPNPDDPPPPPIDYGDPVTISPTIQINDPCQEKIKIKARMENPAIAQIVSSIQAKNDGNEWAAKINAKQLDLKEFMQTPLVSNGASDIIDVGVIDWFPPTGFTIGTVHNHPGGSAPSLDDVFSIYTLPGTSEYGGPYSSEQSHDVYMANAFIAVLTAQGNYVVTIKDWELLKSKYEYYTGHRTDIDNALNGIRNTLLIAPFNYTEGQASAAALLTYLKDTIKLYKSNPNSTTYEPLSVNEDTVELVEVNCPD